MSVRNWYRMFRPQSVVVVWDIAAGCVGQSDQNVVEPSLELQKPLSG